MPRLAAVVAVVALGLVGCSSPTPGAAAVIGDTRIAETALTQQVQAVLKAQGKPLDTPDSALAAQTRASGSNVAGGGAFALRISRTGRLRTATMMRPDTAPERMPLRTG